VEALVQEQYKILRAIVPVHRELQESGQIEISTTPFYHPILPLLVDTDHATIDRPGARHPTRFAYPGDAAAQLRRAVEHYRHCFGRDPRGMWPAEGAVAQFVVPLFARASMRWIATDQGVLARSGRWGYRTDDPDVLCQPYRAEEDGTAISIFFRDTDLSDAIGFRYQAHEDPAHAAREFLEEIRYRFARRVRGEGDRVLTVVLDGENAWGAYRDDARPFLHALYGLLEVETEIETVTFAGYLDGDAARALLPHPADEQPRVHELFNGSWIDENGSAPGVDLGTWIGEEEENRAWELLGAARAALEHEGATPEHAPAAFEALYTAEGSDWFWWFGDDQESGNDGEFDALFRTHLRNVYHGAGLEPPPALERHILPSVVVWTFTDPIGHVQAGDRLVVRTHCPGVLTWWTGDGTPPREEALVPAGGAMAGVSEYHLTIGPLTPEFGEVRFRFRCTNPGCSGEDVCCRRGERAVRIT
jgi:alpha-amylase/alpha-mannosidase (GH57 family)